MKNNSPACKINVLPLFVFLVTAVSPVVLQAQPYKIGSPLVRMFERHEYAYTNAGPQQWAVESDTSGNLYFGNNEGILRLKPDGQWELTRLRNKTILRSLAIGHNRNLYFGGQGIFGVFPLESDGNLGTPVYLSDKILSNTNRPDFEDVWQVFVYDSTVTFTTFKKIIRYDEMQRQVFQYPAPAGALFEFGFQDKRDVYAFQQQKGLVKLDISTGSFNLIPDGDIFNGNPVKALIRDDANHRWIIATETDGLYEFDGQRCRRWLEQLTPFLREIVINAGVRIGKDQLAFSTKLNGLIIINYQGQLVAQINRDHGLSNDNVISMKETGDGALWLGLHNGIARVDKHLPWQYVFIPPYKQIGAHSSAVFDETLYLATPNGVYAKSLAPRERIGEEFHLVDGTVGEAWHLAKIDNGQILLLGHHGGAFTIEHGRIKKISEENGFWRFIQMPHDKDVMVAGNYSGLALFRRNHTIWGDKWQYEGQINGLPESSRIMEMDTGRQIWVTHVYKGVFRCKLSKDYKIIRTDTFEISAKLPGNLNINVFKIRGEIVFGSERGVYYFDARDNLFHLQSSFSKFFGDTSFISLMVEDPYRDGVWFVKDGRPGLLLNDGQGGYRLAGERELPGFNSVQIAFKSDFEQILPISSTETLFGTADGFIKYGPNTPVTIIYEPWKKRIEAMGKSAMALLLLLFLLAFFLTFWWRRKLGKAQKMVRNQQSVITELTEISNNNNIATAALQQLNSRLSVEVEDYKTTLAQYTGSYDSGLRLLIEQAYAHRLQKIAVLLTTDPDEKSKGQNKKDLQFFLTGIEPAEKQLIHFSSNNPYWKKRLMEICPLEKAKEMEFALALRDGYSAIEMASAVGRGKTQIESTAIKLRQYFNLESNEDLIVHLRFLMFPELQKAAHYLRRFIREDAFKSDEINQLSSFAAQLASPEKQPAFVIASDWAKEISHRFDIAPDSILWPYLILLRNGIGPKEAKIILDIKDWQIEQFRNELNLKFGDALKASLNYYRLKWGIVASNPTENNYDIGQGRELNYFVWQFGTNPNYGSSNPTK